MLVGASLVGYVLLAAFFPLIAWYDRVPVADIRTFAPSLREGSLYAVLILALFAMHYLLYVDVVRGWRPSLGLIVGITFLFSLPMIFLYPINANDIFRYVIRGLIRSEYQANPYVMTPAEAGEGIYAVLAGEWASATSPYGPIWELAASSLTAIGRENLLLNLLLFKMLGLLALVVGGVLLWYLLAIYSADRGAVEPGQTALTLLWMWNPALVLSFVGQGHNDAVMIAVLLLGWSILVRGHAGPGLVIMLAAALVKPIAILVLPFAGVYAWQSQTAVRSRMLLIAWLVFGGTVLTVLAFQPFGSPIGLLERLVFEASGGSSFSPVTLAILLSRELDLPLTFSLIARGAVVLFGMLYFWLLWRTWRGRNVEKNIALILASYAALALNFRIWYATWPFPWFLLDAGHGRQMPSFWLRAGMWYLVTSQLSVILYGHLRVALMHGDLAVAHMIGVPFVFLLPLLLAGIGFPRGGSQQEWQAAATNTPSTTEM